jgi:Rrf2 family protein
VCSGRARLATGDPPGEPPTLEEVRATIVSMSADYALRAMVHLARDGGPGLVSLDEIASVMRTPSALLARIMRRLVRAGLVEARCGHHGGFRLGIEPERITVADIVQAIDGPLRMFDCLRAQACGMSGDCNVIDVFARAESALDAVFRSVTLRDLVTQPHRAAHQPVPAGARSAIDLMEG